jgi:hypothetical protein
MAGPASMYISILSLCQNLQRAIGDFNTLYIEHQNQ